MTRGTSGLLCRTAIQDALKRDLRQEEMILCCVRRKPSWEWMMKGNPVAKLRVKQTSPSSTPGFQVI